MSSVGVDERPSDTLLTNSSTVGVFDPANWPASFEAQIQQGDTGDSWAVSAQCRASSIRRPDFYALPENGGVSVTVGTNGDFLRTRHSRTNEYPGWNVDSG